MESSVYLARIIIQKHLNYKFNPMMLIDLQISPFFINERYAHIMIQHSLRTMNIVIDMMGLALIHSLPYSSMHRRSGILKNARFHGLQLM